MATGNNSRDVKMTLSVETLGTEDIQKLQTDVARLAKEGGEAAPEFQRLADEIGRLGEQAEALRSFQALSDQTAELAARQEQASAATSELRTKLDALQATTAQNVASQKATAAALAEAKTAARETRDALAVLSNETDRASKSEDAYINKKKALVAAAITQRAEVERLSAALVQAKASVNEATTAQSTLTTAYNLSAKASDAANAALTANTQKVQEASAVALNLGVVTDNVAAAQVELVQALNTSGSAADSLAQRVERLSAFERELEGIRAFEKQAEDARKLVEAGEYVRFWRTELEKSEAQVLETAQASAAAGQKIKDAFQVLGVRSAQDLQSEIAQVRAAMDTVRGSAAQTGSSLAGAFNAGEARIKSLEREIRKVSGELTTADRAAGLLQNSIGQISAGNIIADGVGYLINKIKELATAFVTTIVQTEQLRKGLQAVYKDTALASAQFDVLKKTANAAGVDVAGLGQSFLRFAAANKSSNVPLAETNALFLAVARAGGALGLSGEQVNGTLDALGQIASKGTVSMEELRQQLGDRLPGALGLTAKGLGITDAQLIKLVESGGLAYRDFVVPFTKGLSELQGETDGLLPTYKRFQNALTETAQALGDSAFLNVFTAAIKGLAVAVGLILVPVAGFIESLALAAKGMAMFASGAYKDKDALADFQEEVVASGNRLRGLTNSFLGAAGAQDQVTAAQKANTLAMQSAGLAAAKAALSVNGVAASQKAQAFASALAADSTLDYGAKLVQLNTFISEALAIQTKQTEASEKVAKATKIEGDNLVELARLRGDDSALINAQVTAATINLEALAKVNAGHAEETRLLQLQRDTLVATALAQDKTLEKRQVEIDAIDKKLVVSAAETEQSKQAEAAARAHVLSIGLSAEAYKDNALKVGEYTIRLAEANAELVRAQFLEGQGIATKKDVADAQAAVAAAQNRFNDSLRDSISLIDRESRAKSASLNITQAKLAVEQAGLLTSAQIARASGDYALALQYEIQAKEVQIKSIRIATEVKKLELNADLAAIEVQRAQIPVGDALRKVKEAELDIRIAVIKAKQLELGVSNEQIRALENEVTALRNSNGERNVGLGSIAFDTKLRDQNTGSIYRQTEALVKQDATKAQYTNPKGGSVTGSSREERLAGQAATDGTGAFALEAKRAAGTLTAGDLGTARAVKSAADFNKSQFDQNFQAFGIEGTRSIFEELNRANTILAQVEALAANVGSPAGATPATRGSAYTVNINMGSNNASVNVASEDDAKALTAFLRGLESGKGTSQ